MKLSDALEQLKSLELRMSEVYLWCSIHFGDLDLRQFFSDMSDEELAHARALDNISRSPLAAKMDIDLPDELPGTIEREIDDAYRKIKADPQLESIFPVLADMESCEINRSFNSILAGAEAHKIAQLDFMSLNTRRHILMLADQAKKLGLSEAVASQLSRISVADRDYFRLFAR
jgi:hypothetical protein